MVKAEEEVFVHSTSNSNSNRNNKTNSWKRHGRHLLAIKQGLKTRAWKTLGWNEAGIGKRKYNGARLGGLYVVVPA